MDVASILKQTGAIDKVAQQLGVDEQTAQAGAAACCLQYWAVSKKRRRHSQAALVILAEYLHSLAAADCSMPLCHPNQRL